MEIPRIEGEGQEPLPGLVPAEPTQRQLPGFPPPLPEEKRYRAHGKEVLRDDKHYGDMIDENAATCAAFALNAADEQAKWALMLALVT